MAIPFRFLVIVSTILLLAAQASAEAKNGFQLDDASLPAAEIVEGGPPRDGIPAITNPQMVPPPADFLEPLDRVLGVVIDDDARAYPIKILNWHEVVNDKIGDQFLAVTWSPLCGAGVAFATNAAETRLIFGVSGLLYNNDLLMYDHNTESLWSQMSAEAVSGELKGVKLPQIPTLNTTWQHWQALHPKTKVMSENTGFRRNYNASPYAEYWRTPRLMFGVSNKAPDTFHPKELVLGIAYAGKTKVYPFPVLRTRERKQFEDTIGFRRVHVHFDLASAAAWITDPEGKDLPTTMSYWFAWYTFHPGTDVYE